MIMKPWDLPIRLSFFRKLELYQDMRVRDSRVGDDKAWSGEKEILRWTARGHRHLGSPIDAGFVEKNILMDRKKYDNFPSDAQRPMENLIVKEYATGSTSSLLFSKDGLLMGEVIDEALTLKRFRYTSFIGLVWVTVICGALAVICGALTVAISLVKELAHFF
jgi:hypothetical protein